MRLRLPGALRLSAAGSAFDTATASRGAKFWLALLGSSYGQGPPQPMRDPRFIEVCLWALCFFLLTTPFTFSLTGADPTVAAARNLGSMRRADDSQLALYALRIGTMAITLLLALRRWETMLRGLQRFLAFAPLLLWETATLLWTDSVDTTLHGLIAQICLLFAAFYISLQMPPQFTARALAYSGLLVGLSSVAWVLFMPRFGLHQHNDAFQAVHAGAWRGVYMHKNVLGQGVAILAAGIFFAGRSVIRHAVVKWALFGFMLVVIVLSTSASALALVPAAIFLVWLTVMLDPLQRMIATIYSIAATIAGLLSVNALLAALGRDMTFSGRTTVWSVAFESILGRPFTGYGYVSITYGSFSYELIRRMGVLDPHNAFLDMILGTGLIGFVLFLILILRTWSIARRLYLVGGGDRQAALVLYAAFIAWLIACLTESVDRPFSFAAATGLSAMAALFAIPVRRRRARRAEPVDLDRGVGLVELGDMPVEHV